jgi:hypothetical protein
MPLQWLKQPDGTLVLWDTAKGGTPLSAGPADKKQTTDTTDTARQLFEDNSGTKSPGPLDWLAKDDAPQAPPTTGDGRVDFNALINAILSKPDTLEGGQSVGTADQASPAQPSTGEQAAEPKASVGKLKGGDYPGAEAFVQGLVKRGWTPQEAAAAAGNAHVESGFKPGIKSSAPNEKSYGFLQWNSERLQGLKNMAKDKGLNWQDPEAQLDWIHMERTGESTKYGGTDEKAMYKKALASGGSPADMAARFGKYVERPKDLSQSVQQRMSAANSYLKYATAQAPASDPPLTQVAANPLHKEQPFSGQTMDEEMLNTIVGGASWA